VIPNAIFTVTTAGEKIIAGTFYNFDSTGNLSGTSLFVACLNANDSLIWCKQFAGEYYPFPLQLLSLSNNRVLFIFQDNDGHQYLIRMFCLNENGELQWAKRTGPESYALNACTDFSGNNIFLAGSTGHVIKLNSNGDVIWSKWFAYNSNYSFNKVALANDSEIVVLSWLDLMKLDTNGNFKWYSHVKNGEKGSTSYYPVSVCSLGDSGFIETISVAYYDDMFTYYSGELFAFDHNGNLTHGKSGPAVLGDVVTIGNQVVCIEGNLLSGLNVNTNLSCSGMQDISHWSWSFETINPVDQAMLLDDNPALETFHLPGLIPTTVTFQTNCFSTQVVNDQLTIPFGGQNIDTTSTSDSTAANSALNYSIYPNPAQDVFYFAHNNLIDGTCSLELYDMIGRRVGKWHVPETNAVTKIDVLDLPSAVYLLSINYDHVIYKMKLLKY